MSRYESLFNNVNGYAVPQRTPITPPFLERDGNLYRARLSFS